MPYLPGLDNHAGYCLNHQSTDAWSEGLAAFLSMMVAKHIAGDPQPHRYHYQYPGYYEDHELDYRAWRPARIGEETAESGVLLDLEDGPADYAARIAPGLKVVRQGLVEAEGQRALVGMVRNEGLEDALSVFVFAAFYDVDGRSVHLMKAMVHPRDLIGTAPNGRLEDRVEGQTGTFGMSLAGVPPFDRYEVAVRDIVGGGVGMDDDRVQIPLQNLWQTIVTWRSTDRRHGNYYPCPVRRSLPARCLGRVGRGTTATGQALAQPGTYGSDRDKSGRAGEAGVAVLVDLAHAAPAYHPDDAAMEQGAAGQVRSGVGGFLLRQNPGGCIHQYRHCDCAVGNRSLVSISMFGPHRYFYPAAVEAG